VRASRRALRGVTTRSTKAGLVIGALTLLAVVPACSSSSSIASLSTPTTTSAATRATTATATATTPTTPTTAPVTVPDEEPARIAACTATAKVVEVALDAYQAEKGTYPSPAPWSAATYASNYQALTASGGGGPFISETPMTTFFVIAFDSAGHVWVTPPGSYGPYDKGQDVSLNPDICAAAIG
jgi:hypothetical protein